MSLKSLNVNYVKITFQVEYFFKCIDYVIEDTKEHEIF